MKEDLCKAFCDMLSVRQVPAGLAVGTGVEGVFGDQIGFYVIGPDLRGEYRIEDSGLLVPALESLGADLSNKTRKELFEQLLNQYGAEFNDETGEIVAKVENAAAVPAAALRFVALLLRLQDLTFLSQERAASTFREDALREITRLIAQRAQIKEEDVIDLRLSEWPADIVIRAPDRAPVAVFLAQNDQKVLEALLLQSYAMYEAHIDCSVVALLESMSSVTQKTLTRASNRLGAVPVFREHEEDACKRIVQEVLGREALFH